VQDAQHSQQQDIFFVAAVIAVAAAITSLCCCPSCVCRSTVISSRWTALSAAKHRLNFVDYAVLLLQEYCDMGTLDSVALTVKSNSAAGQQK
jgi:hypothetical protein